MVWTQVASFEPFDGRTDGGVLKIARSERRVPIPHPSFEDSLLPM